MFKECPHPDDKQRMKLSQDLGLKPRQVKFWFQNRRTQMKVCARLITNPSIQLSSAIDFNFHTVEFHVETLKVKKNFHPAV